MPNTMTQVKYTVDAGVAAAFKARCAAESVSMASVISHWMETGQPTKVSKARIDTRPHRRKAVLELIAMLEAILRKEEDYRDTIPEEFQSRYEAADRACDQLAEAISCLEEAF